MTVVMILPHVTHEMFMCLLVVFWLAAGENMICQPFAFVRFAVFLWRVII